MYMCCVALGVLSLLVVIARLNVFLQCVCSGYTEYAANYAYNSYSILQVQCAHMF